MTTVLSKGWVRGRTRHGGPTLQHRVYATDTSQTVCGLNLMQWPRRTYTASRGDALFVCRRCHPPGLPPPNEMAAG